MKPLLDTIDPWIGPLIKEYPWLESVFSGIGITVVTATLAALGTLTTFLWRRWRRKPARAHPESRQDVHITVTPPPSIKPSPDPERRQRYLERMIQEWNTLRLQALDPAAADARARPLSLEQVYVDLQTTTPRPERLQLKDKERHEQPPLSVVEALCHAESQRMVLLGQPGSGKSTFSRHLALNLARALQSPGEFALSDRLPGWDGPTRLPAVISLGRLAAELKGDGVEQVAAGIRAQIDAYGAIAGYGETLLEELRTGDGLVIFDGLDEVPGKRRGLLKTALGRFATAYPRCWVLVTCRTHSYRQDTGWRLEWSAEHELADFSDAQIEHFVTAWYQARSEQDPGAKATNQRKAATLRAALAPNDPRGLLELARTPLLLTVMAIVHTHKELPGSRVAVYRECVDILLLRWHKSRGGDSERRGLLEDLTPHHVTERQLEQGLCEVAYRAHEAGEADRFGGGGRALVGGDTLRGVLHRHFRKSNEAVGVFLDYCRHANGLLLAQGAVTTVEDGEPERIYAFPHLSFEEYMAARHLRRLRGGCTSKAAELAGDSAWREVVRFLGEYLCHDRDGDIDLALALLKRLCPEDTPTSDADWRRVWLAGDLLPAVRQEAQEEDRDRAVETRIASRLVDCLGSAEALVDAPQDRAAVGRALARVGDPRPGVGLRDKGLPDIAWARIPGTAAVRESGRFPEFAAFKMGEFSFEIDDFALAVYPVTVAQYRPFVDRGGYGEDRYWSKAGRQMRDEESWEAPASWESPLWTLANHPVVGVSWYEAEAYCNWLNAQLPAEQAVRLATEAEWEWAARGPKGRKYPWGEVSPEGRCNYWESGIRRTSAVGAFPSGAGDWWQSWSGDDAVLQDLSGNVYEWVGSEHTDDYSTAGEYIGRNRAGGYRVIRGGAWNNEARSVRAARRYSWPPEGRFDFVGFRLARTLML